MLLHSSRNRLERRARRSGSPLLEWQLQLLQWLHLECMPISAASNDNLCMQHNPIALPRANMNALTWPS